MGSDLAYIPEGIEALARGRLEARRKPRLTRKEGGAALSSGQVVELRRLTKFTASQGARSWHGRLSCVKGPRS